MIFIIMLHLSCCQLPNRSRGAQEEHSLSARCSLRGNGSGSAYRFEYGRNKVDSFNT